jgi:hypothetical protein
MLPTSLSRRGLGRENGFGSDAAAYEFSGIFMYAVKRQARFSTFSHLSAVKLRAPGSASEEGASVFYSWTS